MRRPFLISGIIGIGVIIISLVLMITGPHKTGPMADGFFTPIIAFEFATTVQDVNLIFFDSSSKLLQPAVDAVIFGSRLDFLFMLIYGAFLLSFSLICRSLAKNRLFYLAAGLSILAPIFDLMENLQLLSILDQIGSDEIITELSYLHLFTWLKWGTLALIFLLLIPFFKKSGVFGRFLALFATLPFFLGILAYLKPGLASELFSLCVSSMILLMVLFSFLFRESVQSE